MTAEARQKEVSSLEVLLARTKPSGSCTPPLFRPVDQVVAES